MAYSQDTIVSYKKRVLESVEIDLLASYYSQDGDNAAVTGGIGTEELTDLASSIVVSIPLNDDDVLKIDANVSAYTSASSSNVSPFDSGQPADPFVADSGASANDLWLNGVVSYSHSSDDRNNIWGANVSVSQEYDYASFGFGGNYSYLLNDKNTELSIRANVFLDSWKIIYPFELRPFEDLGYTPLQTNKRNSYALGFGFSQILSKKAQGSISLDLVQQEGLLSTPFQRVFFKDRDAIIIGNGFQLADDIERLPSSRFKIAIGGRLNYYINEMFVLRSYLRYYQDNWGITSYTASIEAPIKLGDFFTLYPSYRYYTQTKADYFYKANDALSTDAFYTSDYDLSNFNAGEFGLGVSYTDIFTKVKLLGYGLKSINAKASYYNRSSSLSYFMVSGGIKFVQD
ncbi:MAG: DUF3570 domain-containing protein [Bacteroidetes bacterium]|jgi:hypothetical protein|nr:DUF3570 domain-containing protein [Bacteroidota bacterium]